jgi:hypothetical protein
MRAVRPFLQGSCMDINGARHLADRIRAGVGVGAVIVLERDSVDSDLRAGDRGVVSAITPEGIVVEWERGFSLSIDADATPFQVFAV